jgi:hypothetical protein
MSCGGGQVLGSLRISSDLSVSGTITGTLRGGLSVGGSSGVYIGSGGITAEYGTNSYIDKLMTANLTTDNLTVNRSCDCGCAGYTEMFEWADGNPNNEDRRGKFVTTDGKYIKLATPEDMFILGAIDPTPAIVLDAAADEWTDKYLKDEFGAKLYDWIEVPAELDEEGNIVKEAFMKQEYRLNPEWDENAEYIPRSKRPEWAAISSKGKFIMLHDGTCQANGFATVGEGGVCTHSDTNYAVRVLERIDDTHIRIYIDSTFMLQN